MFGLLDLLFAFNLTRWDPRAKYALWETRRCLICLISRGTESSGERRISPDIFSESICLEGLAQSQIQIIFEFSWTNTCSLSFDGISLKVILALWNLMSLVCISWHVMYHILSCYIPAIRKSMFYLSENEDVCKDKKCQPAYENFTAYMFWSTQLTIMYTTI